MVYELHWSSFISAAAFVGSVIICTNVHLSLEQGVVCPKKADIVFLLDESTSIVAASGDASNWNVYILGFVAQVIDSFPISQDLTRIGVVKFSTTADANGRIYLNQYNNSVDLKSAVSAEKITGGETDLADGIRTARTVMFSAANGARMGIPHLLIILTDGKSGRETDLIIPEANLTKSAGIEIFTVGMTNQIDEYQLRAVSSDPVESHYFYVSNYSKLSTIVAGNTLIVSGSCAAAQELNTTTKATTSNIIVPGYGHTLSTFPTQFTTASSTSQSPISSLTSYQTPISSSTSQTPISSSTSSQTPISSSTSSQTPVSSLVSKTPINTSTSSQTPISSSTSSQTPISSSTSSETPVSSLVSKTPINTSTSSQTPVSSSASDQTPISLATSSQTLINSSTSQTPISASISSQTPISSSTSQTLISSSTSQTPFSSSTSQTPISSLTSSQTPVSTSTSFQTLTSLPSSNSRTTTNALASVATSSDTTNLQSPSWTLPTIVVISSSSSNNSIALGAGIGAGVGLLVIILVVAVVAYNCRARRHKMTVISEAAGKSNILLPDIGVGSQDEFSRV